jgi:NAD(P)-dependent dehydrogenase (short-subunit alcohol dehydrogenase family)
MNPVTSYRSSKTGLNMLMREWAKILKNDGVKVFAISPGFLATGLAGVGAEQLKKVSSLCVRSDTSCNVTDLELYRWALGIHPKAEHSFAMLWRAREIKTRAR